MLNNVIIQGRLVRDPELRQTPSGVNVANFTVACERDFKNGCEKVSDFIDCVAWRGTAEFISKYFGKGRMIIVVGKMQSHKWVDSNGQNRTGWEVQVDQVYFADSKKEGGENNTTWKELPTQGDFDALLDADTSDLPF